MKFTEGDVYHVYNRGNNNQKIFFNDDNYIFFLRKVRKELLPYCEILAYCLMPNHFHLMILVKSSDDFESSDDYRPRLKESPDNDTAKRSKRTLNQAIAILLRSYTRAIQKQRNTKGSLFQQKTKAQELSNNTGLGLNHPATCMHYIHQNPLKAGLVSKMEDWQFSSYRDYAGIRAGTLCNKEAAFLVTGISGEDFIEESRNVIVE